MDWELGPDCTHHTAASIADLSAADVVVISSHFSLSTLSFPFPDVTKVRGWSVEQTVRQRGILDDDFDSGTD